MCTVQTVDTAPPDSGTVLPCPTAQGVLAAQRMLSSEMSLQLSPSNHLQHLALDIAVLCYEE